VQQFQPFPDLSGIGTIHFGGDSNYNSLQTKLEKRTSHGLTFLATAGTVVIVAGISQALVTRIGPRPVMTIGLALITMGAMAARHPILAAIYAGILVTSWIALLIFVPAESRHSARFG